MRVLALLDGSGSDHDVLRSTRRLAVPGDFVLVCSVLPPRVAPTAGSEHPMDVNARDRYTGATAPVAVAARELRVERLRRDREIRLQSLSECYLSDLQTAVDVTVSTVPVGRVLQLIRRFEIDTVVTGVEERSRQERRGIGGRERALIGAGEVPVMVVLPDRAAPLEPVTRSTAVPDRSNGASLRELIEMTEAPALLLDHRFRISALNDATTKTFRLDRARILGRVCYEVLCPTDTVPTSACGEQCPVLDRLRAGEAVRLPRHRWRGGHRGATAFDATCITIPQAWRGESGPAALLIAEASSYGAYLPLAEDADP